jgi:hypothetical protein
MSEAEISKYHQNQLPGHPPGCGAYALAMAENLFQKNNDLHIGALNGENMEYDWEHSGHKLPSIGVPFGFDMYQNAAKKFAIDSDVQSYTDKSIDDLIMGLAKGELNIVCISWENTSTIIDELTHGQMPGIGHYMVLVGYDPNTKELIFLDPANANKITCYPKDEFEQKWRKQPNPAIPAGSVTVVKKKEN